MAAKGAREVAELEKTTLPQLWKRELADLRVAYDAFAKDFSQDTDDLEEKPARAGKLGASVFQEDCKAS